MTGYARGAVLETEIRAALTAAVDADLANVALADVTVTRNPAQIDAALRHGPVLVLHPPDAEFTTYTARALTWELHLITGPQNDRIAAWNKADLIIGALADPLNLASAKTSEYQPAGNETPWPAYVLTLTEII
jgi:hypothetical protein